MKALLKMNHWIGKIEYYLIACSIIGMAILLIINAVGRTAFHYSLNFSAEVCEILVIILTFIGLSNAARKGKHVTMTAIYDKLSKKNRRRMNIFISAVSCVLLLLFAALCITYVLKVYANGRFTTVLNIPMYLIVSIMPIGFLLGAFQYFLQCVLSIKNKDVIYVGSEKIESDSLMDEVSAVEEITKNLASETAEDGKIKEKNSGGDSQ